GVISFEIEVYIMRNCSSFQAACPGASGSRRRKLLAPVWQTTQGEWPGRFFMKIGATLVLNISKSGWGAGAACDAPTAMDAALKAATAANTIVRRADIQSSLWMAL